TPTNQYQRFCNAFGYYRMVNTRNPTYPKVSLCAEYIESKIREYLATPIPIQGFMRINQLQPNTSQNPKSAQTNQVLQKPIEDIIVADSTPPPNAAAQRKAMETINTTNTKLAELQRIYNSTNDLEIRNNLLEHMATLKQVLHDEDNKIKKLK
ncbi:10643_t:CDS:2, partial [Rhizophagus irregularis]